MSVIRPTNCRLLMTATVAAAAALLSGCSGVAGPNDAAPPTAARTVTTATGRSAPSPVYDAHARAASVVFVVESCGTMLAFDALLKRELKEAVRGLRDGEQSYRLLYCVGGSVVTETPPARDRLIVAGPAAKLATVDLIEGVTPTGLPDTLPALEEAFRLKPDVVYLVASGDFNNLHTYEEYLAAVTRLSAANGGRTRLETVQFDFAGERAVGVMREMSRRTGGRFRAVRPDDLTR